MSIHIVTHAYAKELPQYAAFLRIHLDSLLIYKPEIPVEITICCSSEDDNVLEVLNSYQKDDSVGVLVFFESKRLFRRSIGRNIAARHTKSDIVWFADVDHYFGKGCLDSLWNTWQSFSEKPNLLWPKSLLISANHEAGDAFWQQIMQGGNRGNGLKLPDPSHFVKKPYNKAIGGVQIANGDYCRKFGYLNDHPKWQRGNDKPFGDFRDDIKFRKECLRDGKGVAISIPELYRLRHSLITYR